MIHYVDSVYMYMYLPYFSFLCDHQKESGEKTCHVSLVVLWIYFPTDQWYLHYYHYRFPHFLTKSGSDSVVHTHLNSLSGNNSISVLKKKFPNLFVNFSPVHVSSLKLKFGVSEVLHTRSVREDEGEMECEWNLNVFQWTVFMTIDHLRQRNRLKSSIVTGVLSCFRVIFLFVYFRMNYLFLTIPPRWYHFPDKFE
jgi:hypothetical protein